MSKAKTREHKITKGKKLSMGLSTDITTLSDSRRLQGI